MLPSGKNPNDYTATPHVGRISTRMARGKSIFSILSMLCAENPRVIHPRRFLPFSISNAIFHEHVGKTGKAVGCETKQEKSSYARTMIPQTRMTVGILVSPGAV